VKINKNGIDINANEIYIKKQMIINIIVPIKTLFASIKNILET
jgi:hypothetical protein